MAFVNPLKKQMKLIVSVVSIKYLTIH